MKTKKSFCGKSTESNNTITINVKNYELDENDIFQRHIPISVDEFCELLEQNYC